MLPYVAFSRNSSKKSKPVIRKTELRDPHCFVTGDSSLAKCDTLSIGKQLPTFPKIVVSTASG
jgi:hypothetical protein